MADDAPWLLVGLGNPGPRYARNRHNVGFMAVEAWCEQFVPPPVWTDKWKARTTTVRLLGGVRCVVLEPQTYMNRSGSSAVLAARYFRIPAQQILVVHDEIDFPPGRIAVKKGGGHGGHNGLRDLVQQLGTRDFLRIRLGVGRPADKSEVSRYVLADFSAQDQLVLPELLASAARAISCVLKDGVATAMNRFNKGPKKGAKRASSSKKPKQPKPDTSTDIPTPQRFEKGSTEESNKD